MNKSIVFILVLAFFLASIQAIHMKKSATKNVAGRVVIAQGVATRKSNFWGSYLRSNDAESVDLVSGGGQVLWHQDFTKINDFTSTGWNLQILPEKKYDGSGIQFTNQGMVIFTHFDSSNKIVSGRMNTQKKLGIKYGYIQAQIKFDQGNGLWPAFWMLGDVDQGWPDCGQTDIMEWVGKFPNSIFGTLHGPGYSANRCYGSQNNDPETTARSSNILNKPLSKEWHTFAVNWEPNRIQWFIDNISYFTVTPESLNSYRPGVKWVYNDRPFYLILNQAFGGDFGGAGLDETAIIKELKGYGSRNFTIKSITVSKTKNNYGEVSGPLANNSLSTLDDAVSKDIQWHWYYLDNNQFFWQSEQYKTFLSANPDGSISLVVNPEQNEIWIKQDKSTYNNWKSLKFGSYLSARDDGSVNLQKVPDTWQRWND